MLETIQADENICCLTIETESGWIDICTNDKDEKVVNVCHDSDETKHSPRLADEIEGIIPDWGEIEDLAEQDKPESILDEAFGTWEQGFYN